MRLLSKILIFVSTFVVAIQPAEAAGPQCIVGDEKNLALTTQFDRDLKTSKFLQEFLADNSGVFSDVLCATTGPHSVAKFLYEKIDDILKTDKISLECIKGSMRRIENINGTNRLVCTSNTAKPTFVAGEPCVTDQAAHVVHWGINKALECANALATNNDHPPLDPGLLFQKINNESAFGFHLQNTGGIGLGQLTSIAVHEIIRPSMSFSAKYDTYIDAANAEPRCAPFRSVLEKQIEFTASGDVRLCQLVSPGEGIARNLFFSTALFLHHRDTHGKAIGPFAKNLGITDATKLNYFTLVSYGRGGLDGARAILDQMVKKYGAKNLNRMPIDEFQTLLSKHSQYFSETQNKMGQFLKSYYRPGGNPELTPADLRGEACVE